MKAHQHVSISHGPYVAQLTLNTVFIVTSPEWACPYLLPFVFRMKSLWSIKKVFTIIKIKIPVTFNDRAISNFKVTSFSMSLKQNTCLKSCNLGFLACYSIGKLTTVSPFLSFKKFCKVKYVSLYLLFIKKNCRNYVFIW